ncbi:MAG: hypothetical protein HY905_23700 [Deltaproteobacteria bacterium]|nr:hypothetical protein [Deltaproteobacteria bacterium]
MVVRFLAAVLPAGCSLLYPFELPDEDGGDAADAVEATEDGPAEDAGAVCGNGSVESPEECDGDPERSCSTACGSSGTQTCTACVWSACAPPPDNCNGLDDDCDTVTDGGYPCAANAEVPCTTPCGVAGSGTCSATCEPPPRSACAADGEACNGCDDNRDGATDEGCACVAGWAVEHPLAPGPESLYGIGAAQDGSGWAFAVGSTGQILQYDGTEWTRAASVGTDTIRWVDVPRRDFAVAVGQLGSVYWWNGTSWRFDDTSGTPSVLYAVDCIADDDIWAVGAGGAAVHWDGTGWYPSATGTPRHLYGVLAFAHDDVFAVGTNGTVMRFDGASWTRISPPWLAAEIETVWSTSDGARLYVAGTAGAVAVWERATGTWTSLPTGTLETIYSLWGAGENDLWAVGGNTRGTILHFDGATWTENVATPSLDRRGYLAASGTAADDIYAVLHDGGIMHCDGTSWRPMEGAVTVSLHGISGTSSQAVFAVGSTSTPGGPEGTALLRYDGRAWRLANWQTGFAAVGLWTAAANDIFAVFGDQRVRRFDGSTWAAFPVGFPDFRWFATWGLSAAQTFLVGGQDSSGGQPLIFQGAAGSWSAVVTPTLPDVDLNGVAGTTAADDVLAVGTAGTILRIHPGDWSVEQDMVAAAPTDTLRAVWPASPTEAFAVGDNGAILHWDGTSWNSMTTSSDPWFGYRLYAVWGSSPSNVFAAGESDMLVRYDGVRWRTITIDTLADFTGIWGSAANNVFLVSNDRSGKILHRCGSAW